MTNDTAWNEDGTGSELIDGSTASCDAAYNRGYDAGYTEGLKAGTPPVRLPRWDQDPVVLRFGFLTGRCGNCGEEYRADELRGPLVAAERSTAGGAE